MDMNYNQMSTQDPQILAQLFAQQQQAQAAAPPPPQGGPVDPSQLVPGKTDPAVALQHLTHAGIQKYQQLQRNDRGELTVSSERGPLARLFGAQPNQDPLIHQTNYYDTLKQIGATNLLPSGLRQTPEGIPFVDADTFQRIASSRQLPSGNNPMLDKETAVTLGILTPEQADKLYKTPDQTHGLNELRLGVLASTANTRKGMLDLGRNKLEQSQIDNLVNSIADAKQTNATPLGQQANKLNNVIHARQLLSQSFNPDTGEYDLSKAASSEVIMGVARAVSQNGQLSDRTQEELSSPTAYGRMKGLLQFYTGSPVNANPQEITKMYRDMLDRQGTISQDLFNASAAREIPKGLMLQKSNPLAYAAVMQNSFGTHDYRAMIANLEDAKDVTVRPPTQLGGRGTPPAPVAAQPTAAAAPQKLDPQTRFSQLIKSGLSKAQAYKLMHTEGY